jgi:hypothetical protein
VCSCSAQRVALLGCTCQVASAPAWSPPCPCDCSWRPHGRSGAASISVGPGVLVALVLGGGALKSCPSWTPESTGCSLKVPCPAWEEVHPVSPPLPGGPTTSLTAFTETWALQLMVATVPCAWREPCPSCLAQFLTEGLKGRDLGSAQTGDEVPLWNFPSILRY